MGKLFEELKRRKVFRVAAVYAVVAWVLIQVADVVLPTFGAPEWVNQTLIFLFFLGFPLAITLSWAYEITPDGIRTDASKQSQQVVVNGTDPKLIYAILGLVLLVAGFQITDRFLTGSEVRVDTTSIALSTDVTRADIMLGFMDPVPHRGLRTSIAISPDGSRLAYTDFVDEKSLLYVRELDRLEPRLIGEIPDNPDWGASLFFSPDGETVGFHGPRELMKIGVQGGLPQSVLNYGPGTTPFGGFWFEENTILFSYRQDLVFLPAAGGSPDKLEFDAPIEGYFNVWPHLLPGEKFALFSPMDSSSTIEAEGGVYLLDVDTGESRKLIEQGHNARYASSGHIVFIRSRILWAAPFDLDRMEITGAEVQVQSGIAINSRWGTAVYSFSDNGRLVYLPGNDTFDSSNQLGDIRRTRLMWVDKEGREELLDLPPQFIEDPMLSPDGQRLAVIRYQSDGVSDIWVYDFNSGAYGPVTFYGDVQNPLWTPDSQRLLFDRGSDGNAISSIWAINANGTGQAEQLFDPMLSVSPRAFSLDGTKLIYVQRNNPSPSFDLYMADVSDIVGTSQALLTSEFRKTMPAISPDGQWLAYSSNESGQYQVYVRPFPNVDDDRIQVSLNGGREPRWSDNGQELYYMDADASSIVSVALTTEPEFSVGERKVIYFDPDLNTTGGGGGNWPVYAYSFDQQRFLVSKFISELDDGVTPVVDTATQSVFTSLVLVENWFEELKRLAPPDLQ